MSQPLQRQGVRQKIMSKFKAEVLFSEMFGEFC